MHRQDGRCRLVDASSASTCRAHVDELQRAGSRAHTKPISGLKMVLSDTAWHHRRRRSGCGRAAGIVKRRRSGCGREVRERFRISTRLLGHGFVNINAAPLPANGFPFQRVLKPAVGHGLSLEARFFLGVLAAKTGPGKSRVFVTKQTQKSFGNKETNNCLI